MPGEKLYGIPAEQLKWGIASGEHVPHLYNADKNTKTKEIVEGAVYDDYKSVSQVEVYNNPADNSTAEFFSNIARDSAQDYEADYADKQFKGVLESMRDYVTATGRQAQQDKLIV